MRVRVISVVAVMGLTMGLASVAPPASAAPTLHSSGLELVGPTVDDPVLLPEKLLAAQHDAQELAEANPWDFAYPYVDSQLDRVVMTTASTAGAAQANTAQSSPSEDGTVRPLTTRRVPNSYAKLESIKDEASRLEGVVTDGDLIWATEPDPARNRVVISVSRVSDALLTTLAARYGTTAIAIRVEAPDELALPGGRDNDTSPFWGGASIRSPLGCTTAFSWISGSQHMMLTAGHCVPSGGSVATPSQTIGSVTANSRENWDNTTGTTHFTGQSVNRGDLALIQMSSGRSSGTSIYRGGPGSSSSSPVREMWYRSPALGDQYCVGGKVTGELCGWKVNKVRYNQRYGNSKSKQWVRNINRGKKKGICTAKGDSGGPVYTVRSDGGIAAKGVHSGLGGGGSDNYGGTLDPCYEYFTDIWEAYRGLPGVLRRA